jgi:hypothetical protein
MAQLVDNFHPGNTVPGKNQPGLFWVIANQLSCINYGFTKPNNTTAKAPPKPIQSGKKKFKPNPKLIAEYVW